MGVSGFFSEAHGRKVASEIKAQVARLREIVEGLPHWRFWNISLLLLHDGADSNSPALMRMIDFAHCALVQSPTPDAEFVCGLRNLETYLEAFAEDRPFYPHVAANLAQPPPESVQDAEELEESEDNRSAACRS